MKIKKLIPLILVISMICVLTLAFSACADDKEDGNNDDVKGDDAAAENQPEESAPEPQSFLKKAETGERNNYNGSVGYEILCLSDITVSAVGRPLNSEMNDSHTVYIWEVSTQNLVASAEIKPDAPLDNLGFKTARLSSPVTLKAGESYRIVSSEYKDGDKWYDVGTAETDPIPDLQPNSECEIVTPAFSGENEHGSYPNNQYNPGGLRGYVGVTFYYLPVS